MLPLEKIKEASKDGSEMLDIIFKGFHENKYRIMNSEEMIDDIASEFAEKITKDKSDVFTKNKDVLLSIKLKTTKSQSEVEENIIN